MTLLFMDGFETARRLEWSGVSLGTTTGRDGVGLAAYPTNNDLATVSFSGSSTVMVGFGRYAPSGYRGSTSRTICMLYSDGVATKHLSVTLDATGYVQLRRGAANGSVIATATAVVPASTWFHMEIKATVHDTAGTAVVRLNGVEVINYTGDTRNGGTSTLISGFGVNFYDGSATDRLDDLYVLDNAGAAPYNDFLGDVKIAALRPTGNGTVNQYVGSDSDSVDNWALVDEATVSTSDYVGDATPGNRDLYQLSDIAAGYTVYATQTVGYASKSDAGDRSVKLLNRNAAGTVAASDPVPLSTSWTTVVGPIRTVDPDGNAWTPTLVNGLQSGVETV